MVESRRGQPCDANKLKHEKRLVSYWSLALCLALSTTARAIAVLFAPCIRHRASLITCASRSNRCLTGALH